MHNFNLFENVVSEMLKNFLFYFYFTSCIIGLKEQSINLTKNMLVIFCHQGIICFFIQCLWILVWFIIFHLWNALI